MEELTNAEAQELSPKISVIIPVYRPGDGLRSCIGSLRNQTLSDIEMIFVDDCGGDDAFSIVEAESAEDDRIRIIKNAQNLGAGPSRNRGMEEACGEYLSFVDADDWVAPNFYELLYAQALKTGADIVKGSRSEVGESGNPADGQSGALLNARIRQSLLAGNPLWRSFTYEHQSAIYRREAVLSSGARYGSSRVGQDVTFLLRYCSSGPSIAFVDKAAYYYAIRAESAVRTASSTKFEHQLQAFGDQVDTLVGLLGSDARQVRLHAGKGVESYSSIGLHLMRVTGDGEAASRYFAGMRTQVLRLHDAEGRALDGPVLQALVEYGIPLAKGPNASAGELPHAADWPPITAEWIRFSDVCTHDKAGSRREAVGILRRALFALAHAYGLRGTDDDAVAAIGEIRRQLATSPSRGALFALDPRLALFAAGGPALFLGITRRAKDVAKRVLWRAAG